MKINNGDVFNIGQTVNGVDTFLWFNNKWYYFTERLSDEYEYNHESLTIVVLNENDLHNITFIKNIFK